MCATSSGLDVSRSLPTIRIGVPCANAGTASAAAMTSAVDASSSFLSMDVSSVMLVVCDGGAHPLSAPVIVPLVKNFKISG
jgi:hypothetical protein